MIRERHDHVHHNGVRETLNGIRETHWVLKGREAVKRVIRKCTRCRRYEGKPFTAPPFPDLPTDRVYEGLPFTYTGLDFAGPLHLNSATPENRSKAYCCLFTCASTRALHLELTDSLTVTSFLQAFRRFVSRRGLPAKLLTDNAKTFKSVSVDVKKISRSSEVKQYLAKRQVDWQFIMERAPWLGGFWERLVRSVKRCLKKSVGRSLLTFKELRTLVVEIEATLNNRPLTYIYDDEEGLSYPLTPADLIYGRQIATMPHQRHCNVISTFESLTKRVRYHFRLLDGFTKQWRKEYLLRLHEYHRNRTGAIEQSISRRHCRFQGRRICALLVEASQSHGAIEEQGQRCEVSKDSSSQHRCAKETDRVETRSSTSHKSVKGSGNSAFLQKDQLCYLKRAEKLTFCIYFL